MKVIGLDEALEAIDGLYDEEELAKVVAAILHRLQKVAKDRTPVQTGAMRDAWTVEEMGLIIDPKSRNPRTGTKVTSYAGAVSDRVGVMGAVMAQAEAVAKAEIARHGY